LTLYNEAKVVLLAGGLGTRIQGLSGDIPKCLISTAGRPFIDYLMRLLRQYNMRDLIFSVGYKGELIEEYCERNLKDFNVRFIYDNPKRKGEAFGNVTGLHQIAQESEAPFWIINSDTYFEMDFEVFFRRHLEFNLGSTIAVSTSMDKGSIPNVILDGHLVSKYSKTDSAGCTFVDCGTALFSPDSFLLNKNITDLSALFGKLCSDGKLYGIEEKSRYYHVNDPWSYQEATEFFSTAYENFDNKYRVFS
jgi:D-glycero-alpha-D-manno-heptose 1-phosphate guanylyltransferase